MNKPTQSRDAPAFQVNIQAQDGHLAIQLGGEMDAAAVEELRLVVAQMDTVSDKPAIVDLSTLTFCDPAGLSELLALKRVLKSRHPSVTFTGVSPRIQRIMEIAQVHHLFGLGATDPT
jgi:anti-anti-sigma factor